MSEKNLFPAELRVLLLAGTVGVMVTAGGLAAMAALMTAQGYSGAVAPPLATAAVGAGSLCSGWIAAFCKKERGLLCGLVQGLFYAALLVVLSVPSGTLTEEPPLLRFAVLILCGSIGGLLCTLGTDSLRVSSQIRVCSFFAAGPDREIVRPHGFIRQYLLTLTLFVPLCGISAALASIGSRL